MPSNTKLIDALEKARADLLKVFEGLDEMTLSDTIVSGQWTVKDILGHLVSWGDEFRREVHTILSEQPSYDYTIRADDHFNAWNLAEADKKTDMSWQQALGEFERDGREMTALIESLSKEQLQTKGPVPWGDKSIKVEAIIKIHPSHIKHHTKILQGWKKGL